MIGCKGTSSLCKPNVLVGESVGESTRGGKGPYEQSILP